MSQLAAIVVDRYENPDQYDKLEEGLKSSPAGRLFFQEIGPPGMNSWVDIRQTSEDKIIVEWGTPAV